MAAPRRPSDLNDFLDCLGPSWIREVKSQLVIVLIQPEDCIRYVVAIEYSVLEWLHSIDLRNDSAEVVLSKQAARNFKLTTSLRVGLFLDELAGPGANPLNARALGRMTKIYALAGEEIWCWIDRIYWRDRSCSVHVIGTRSASF